MSADLAGQLAAAQREIAHLRDLDRWKNAFLAAAAHDLRSPVALIASAAQTLQARAGEDLARLLATRIHEQARHLDQLLSDLLDLNRFSLGHVQADRRPADLDELISAALQELTPSPLVDGDPVELAGRYVITDVDPVVAEVDPVRVRQIVVNLLRNASTHTPEGTRIHVTGRATEGAVVLVVEDEGPGIPDDVIDDLFEPFVTRRTHESDGRGTGLGLTLVRLFAELHGGDVTAENRDGGGARFVVTLPTDAAPEGRGSMPQRSDPHGRDARPGVTV